MSELREAAQAVVDAKDNPLNSIEDIEPPEQEGE